MSNAFVIAKKEFSDLAYSKVFIFILALYVVILVYSSYTLYNFYSWHGFEDAATSFTQGLVANLSEYGGLVAIILGFSSMYNELGNKSLNTMLCKPVYRDTILNGKLLGAFLCMSFIFAFVTLLYMSLCSIFFWNVFPGVLQIFLGKLPLVFLVCSLSFITFYSIALLISVYIRSGSLAFLLSFIVWIIMNWILAGTNFPLDLSLIFGQDPGIVHKISSLSPDVMIYLIFNNSGDFISELSAHTQELFRLLSYSGISLVLCYIGFIRGDVG